MSSADFTKSFALEDKSRERERARKIDAEYKSTFIKTTEARSANAFKLDNNSISSSKAKVAELPIWRRLVSTFITSLISFHDKYLFFPNYINVFFRQGVLTSTFPQF